MMKCCFLCEPAGFPTLGVEFLISVLRHNGREVEVVFDKNSYKAWKPYQQDTDFDDEIVQSIVATGSPYLFAYITTINFRRVANLFSKVKRAAPDIVTCVGGPHATYAHENVVQKDSIDFACRGEGEITILEFLDYVEGRRQNLPSGIYRFNHGMVDGIGFGSLVSDLDQLPYPDKTDYFENVPTVRPYYSTITGRGCYNRCTFCNSSTMRQHYRDEGYNFLRRRSVDDVISELSLAKEAYSPNFIWFSDDVFIYNKRYMAEFAEKYAEKVNIPFGCSTIPNFFEESVIASLAHAGLSNVEVGLQSLDPDIRLNAFGRRETNEEFARFTKMLHSHGIYVQTDHIINPWDSRDSLKLQIAEYAEIRPSHINIFHLQYFPDTQVIDRAIDSGFLDESAREASREGYHESFFSGGGISHVVKNFHDLIVLLHFTPFLPTKLTQWLVQSPIVRVLKYVPLKVALPLRAIIALLNKGDIPGRVHLTTHFLSLFRRKTDVPNETVQAVKRISLHKQNLSVSPAAPLASRGGRGRRIEMASSSTAAS